MPGVPQSPAQGRVGLNIPAAASRDERDLHRSWLPRPARWRHATDRPAVTEPIVSERVSTGLDCGGSLGPRGRPGIAFAIFLVKRWDLSGGLACSGVLMPAESEDFTMGVEEEFQIVHPETRELVPRAGRLLPRGPEAGHAEVTNELFLSQIEVGTPVCRTLGEVRSQIVRLRREVIASAARDGSRIAAAGTHPFSHWGDQRLTPKARYFGIADEYQQLAREQIIFGCHVHVGMKDRDAAIRVMNRSRRWLFALLALSGNSPFWLGDDTGYASYRSELFLRFPTVGTPHFLSSRAEYDRVVEDLVAVGMVEDASKIYWDVRPSMHFDTLEFRVADVCTTVDEAVMIAGLCRALARECHARDMAGEPEEDLRPELLKAARWRAARFGLDGDLIDLAGRTTAPAAEMIHALLSFVRPSLEATSDWDEVSSLVDATIARGNGARRQREAFQKAGRMEDVIDQIVAETALGTS